MRKADIKRETAETKIEQKANRVVKTRVRANKNILNANAFLKRFFVLSPALNAAIGSITLAINAILKITFAIVFIIKLL